MFQNRPSAKEILTLAVVITFVGVGILSCTYVWRRSYTTTGTQPKISVKGWQIVPRIVSGETRDQWKMPLDGPQQFVMSFLARHARAQADLYDLTIDSFKIYYSANFKDTTYVPNEAAFVSYAAVSRDSVVKRFSIVDANSHRLIWHLLAEENGSLMVTLYVKLSPGTLSIQKERNGSVAMDTILPDRSGQGVMDTVIETFLARVESKVSEPGLLDVN